LVPAAIDGMTVTGSEGKEIVKNCTQWSSTGLSTPTNRRCEMFDLSGIKSALEEKCHESIAQLLRQALEAAGLDQEDITRVADFMSGKIDLP
jgi:hypothetical protein